MKRIFTLLTMLMLGFATMTQAIASPMTNATFFQLKKDGTKDMRYKANKHLKKDGTKDMRFKANKPAAPKKAKKK